MIITTGYSPIMEIVERAQSLAERTGCSYAPREKLSITRMVEHYGDEDILILSQDAVRLHRLGMEPMEFHPSMGFVRAKRILKVRSSRCLLRLECFPEIAYWIVQLD